MFIWSTWFLDILLNISHESSVSANQHFKTNHSSLQLLVIFDTCMYTCCKHQAVLESSSHYLVLCTSSLDTKYSVVHLQGWHYAYKASCKYKWVTRQNLILCIGDYGGPGRARPPLKNKFSKIQGKSCSMDWHCQFQHFSCFQYQFQSILKTAVLA